MQLSTSNFSEQMLKISPAVREGVKSQLRQLFSRPLSEDAGQETQSLIFKDSLVKQHGISSRGRVDNMLEPPEYYAAPFFSDPIKNTYSEGELSSTYDLMQHYMREETISPHFHPSIPLEENRSTISYALRDYETSLFHRYKPEVLVNPSPITMHNALEAGITKVYVCTPDLSWRDQIIKVARSLDMDVINKIDDSKLYYLGMHGRQSFQMPRWIAFQVHPSEQFFPLQKSEHVGDRVIVSYKKGDYHYSVEYPWNANFFIYNPEQTALTLSTTWRTMCLISSHALGVVSVDMFLGPVRSLNFWPSITQLHGESVRIRDTLLYDLLGEGTYASRRGLMYDFARKHNLKVASYQDFGAWVISMSSLDPLPQPTDSDQITIHYRNNEVSQVSFEDKPIPSTNTSAYIWSLVPFDVHAKPLGLGFFIKIPVKRIRNPRRILVHYEGKGTCLHFFMDYDQMLHKITYLESVESVWMKPWEPVDMEGGQKLVLSEGLQHYRTIESELLHEGFKPIKGPSGSLLTFFASNASIWIDEQFNDEGTKSTRVLRMYEPSSVPFPFHLLKTHRKVVVSIPIDFHDWGRVPDELVGFLSSNGIFTYTVCKDERVTYWVCINNYSPSNLVRRVTLCAKDFEMMKLYDPTNAYFKEDRCPDVRSSNLT